jgi:hypothetical protein
MAMKWICRFRSRFSAAAVVALTFIWFGLTPLGAMAGSSFFVATNGNDSWSGLLPVPNAAHTDGPFATLAKAQSKMRGSSIKLTQIEAGTYTRHANWTFSSADSTEKWIPYNGRGSVTIALNGTYFLNTSGVTGLTIEGLNFSYPSAGTYPGGIAFNGGSRNVFRWNTVTNCKSSCITVNNSPSTLIDSNTLNGETAGAIASSTGVHVAYGSSSVHVTHNLIENIDGCGVSVTEGPSDPVNNNVLISYNLLVNVDRNAYDGGALYIYDPVEKSRGIIVSHNNVFGNGSATHATKCIYLDDGTSYITVTGNICAPNGGGTGPGTYGLFIHGGNNNSITNNIFVLPYVGAFSDYFGLQNVAEWLGSYQYLSKAGGGANNTFQRNIVYSLGTGWSKPLWWAQDGPDAAPLVTNNDYYSAKGTSMSGWGYTDRHPFFANPLFSNPSANNYTVGATSAVRGDIGWVTLPTGQGPLPYAP